MVANNKVLHGTSHDMPYRGVSHLYIYSKIPNIIITLLGKAPLMSLPLPGMKSVMNSFFNIIEQLLKFLFLTIFWNSYYLLRIRCMYILWELKLGRLSCIAFCCPSFAGMAPQPCCLLCRPLSTTSNWLHQLASSENRALTLSDSQSVHKDITLFYKLISS